MDPLTKLIRQQRRDYWKKLAFNIVVSVVLFFAAPFLLLLRPSDYTPVVELLINACLFGFAYHIGQDANEEKARQQASDRWLPQAEAVTYRLMTLFANVKEFSTTMRARCDQKTCDLVPELSDPENKSIRVKIKVECDASAQRLDDIGNQLDDAIGDWQRFIAANCQGEECSRIFDGLQDRWRRLGIPAGGSVHTTPLAPEP